MDNINFERNMNSFMMLGYVFRRMISFEAILKKCVVGLVVVRIAHVEN